MHDISDTARLISLLPPNARCLVEVGGGDGALARQYKAIYPAAFYRRIVGAAEDQAACDVLHRSEIDSAGDELFRRFEMADCWIFDGALERMADAEGVLGRIRRRIAPDACVVARIANGNHWARLGQDSGWSRSAALDLFQRAGYALGGGMALMGPPPQDEAVLDALRRGAEARGADPAAVLQDSLPTHYLIKAVPA